MVFSLFGVLCSCSIVDSSEDPQIVACYQNEMYREADQWHPIGTETTKVAAWVEYVDDASSVKPEKPNDKILLHANDPDNLFVSYNSIFGYTHTLHKETVPFPKVFSVSLSKICLTDLNDESVSEIALEGTLLEEIRFYLEQVYAEDSKVKISKDAFPDWNRAWDVIIYFDKYPAYLDYGVISIFDTGEVVLFADRVSPDYEYTTHVILPEQIANAILNRLE
jgi:hypothetical protein